MTTGIPADVVVRCAVPADALEVPRLFGRCSRETRYRRFHGHVSGVPCSYLCEALTAEPARHDALVAQWPDGDLVALGSARRVDAPDGPAVDLGLLVEDAEQGRGLGTLLLVTVLRRTLDPVRTVRQGGTVSAWVRIA